MSTHWLNETQNLKTILDFLRYAYSAALGSDLYYGHGTDNAWDEMRSLVLRTLNLPLDLDPHLLEGRLTSREKSILCEQLAKRIEQRIPVPYLIHEAWFCGLSFYVDDRVLIPRSPIAELIENQFSPWIHADEVKRILDLCTGSGCIALACCHAFPDATVDAVDISEEALEVAMINQEHLDPDHQLHLIQSDCFAALPAEKYDIIVSNPPYVGAAEMQSLPEEYRYEPVLALQAEQDGLAIVEKILKQASQFLTDHGILVVEVGNSEALVCETWPQLPFTWLEFERGGHGVFVLTKEQLDTHF